MKRDREGRSRDGGERNREEARRGEEETEAREKREEKRQERRNRCRLVLPLLLYRLNRIQTPVSTSELRAPSPNTCFSDFIRCYPVPNRHPPISTPNPAPPRPVHPAAWVPPARGASRPCVHASRERIGCISHDMSVCIACTRPRWRAEREPCSGPVDTHLLAYQRVTNRGILLRLRSRTRRCAPGAPVRLPTSMYAPALCVFRLFSLCTWKTRTLRHSREFLAATCSITPR